MKNVLIFNDISGLGNCSMTANLAVLCHLGHNCMPVATANYSCQTGFEKYTVLLNDQVKKYAGDILSNCNADAIYVGFCNNVPTLQAVTDMLQNTNAFVLVDPILGDNGKLYPIYNQNYVEQMKRTVRYAHCITPNLTEACFLADISYDEVLSHQAEPTFLATVGKIFANFLTTTGAKNAVITGVPCGGLVGNVVLTADGVKYVTNEKSPVNYSGTGDLFSSVLLGEMLNMCNLLQATQIAAIFVGNCAKNTQSVDKRFGLDFPSLLPTLK